VTREQILAALPRFVGRIEQTPPQFSAVKIQGERAYDLARAGRTADVKPRLVDVYRLELLAFDPPELSLEIECGSGTYVRSIGRDLGALLGSGAIMSALVRTRIGPFRIEDSVSLDAITRESLPARLLPAAWAVCDRPRCNLDAARLADLRQGRSVLMQDAPMVDSDGPLAVFGPGGELVALGALRSGRLCPTLVLAPFETPNSYGPV
jgi:tRNA pseudouridine55 synthase